MTRLLCRQDFKVKIAIKKRTDKLVLVWTTRAFQTDFFPPFCVHVSKTEFCTKVKVREELDHPLLPTIWTSLPPFSLDFWLEIHNITGDNYEHCLTFLFPREMPDQGIANKHITELVLITDFIAKLLMTHCTHWLHLTQKAQDCI